MKKGTINDLSNLIRLLNDTEKEMNKFLDREDYDFESAAMIIEEIKSDIQSLKAKS